MNPELTKHIKKDITVNGVTNAFFNWLAAYLLMKSTPPLEWWGKHSFGIDVIATAFILPFIVALIVIPVSRRKHAKGKLPAWIPNPDSSIESIIARFPRSLFLSALLFGLIGTVVFASVTLLGFYLAGIETVDPVKYSFFKGIWAGFIAFCLAGPMIMLGVKKDAE